MLIKVFTSCFDGWDSLNPPLDETDFTVNLYRLPRGYTAETDSRGAATFVVPTAPSSTTSTKMCGAIQ